MRFYYRRRANLLRMRIDTATPRPAVHTGRWGLCKTLYTQRRGTFAVRRSAGVRASFSSSLQLQTVVWTTANLLTTETYGYWYVCVGSD